MERSSGGIRMFRENDFEWLPEATKVGLLYCSAEANSQYQVDEVKKLSLIHISARWSKTQKQRPSSDCRLQLACTKSELLVIVDQHATDRKSVV